MGYYINPPNETKEEFLEREAVPCSKEDARNLEFGQGIFAICLVQNIMFSAAAILVDPREVEEFCDRPDNRKKSFFLIEENKISEFLPKHVA